MSIRRGAGSSRGARLAPLSSALLLPLPPWPLPLLPLPWPRQPHADEPQDHTRPSSSKQSEKRAPAATATTRTPPKTRSSAVPTTGWGEGTRGNAAPQPTTLAAARPVKRLASSPQAQHTPRSSTASE
jgi:hypothetical protein